MNIFIIRHGQTIGNEQGIVQGWIGGELSDEGIRQANDVRKHISKISPDVIVSSDLSRASQSAEILNITNVPIIHDWRLRERFFGTLEGKTSSGQDWLDYFSISDSEHMFGEETAEAVYNRAKDFARSIHLLKNQYNTVLIVTHGGMINVLKTIELGNSYNPKSYDNCEITQINLDKIAQAIT